MKTYSVCVFTIAFFLLIQGCTKNPAPPSQGGNPPPANPPTISAISPDSGFSNTTVTINGANFGTDTAQVKIFFNGAAAVLHSLSATQITAIVPAKAGTGSVMVSVNGKAGQGPVFTYIPSIIVSTLAGNGQAGYADGNGGVATFSGPRGITVDSTGNVYIADFGNHTIRKITAAGEVTTIAGDPTGFPGFVNGTGSTASFEGPNSISLDPVHSLLYVMDGSPGSPFNNEIRMVTLTGAVSYPGNDTIGYRDGNIGLALFSFPSYVSVDIKGNAYVADESNNRLRKIAADGTVTTLAGNGISGTTDGPAGGAVFGGHAWGLAIDPQGTIYYTETLNNSIRKLSGGNVTTLAGGTAGAGGTGGYADGTGSAAKFSSPTGIVADKTGNLYVSDLHNHCIRKITPAGVVTTLVGLPAQSGLVDGNASVARFDGPYGITIDSQGDLYVADYFSNAIRKISFE